MSEIRAIIGLGNPGNQYDNSRHNLGAYFVRSLALSYGIRFTKDVNNLALTSSYIYEGKKVILVTTTTYMNDSGRSVAGVSNFYRIPPESILVVHDELDLALGAVKLKIGGGHGGHNGLRNIMLHLSTRDFPRLRIGIGRPISTTPVSDFVLKSISKNDRSVLKTSIDSSIKVIPSILSKKWNFALRQLHEMKLGLGK